MRKFDRVILFRRLRRSRRRGMSIWGVMLGGLLVAVAMLAVNDVYQSARETQSKNGAIELLQRLQANVRKIYAGNPNYGAADTDLVPVLASRGAIPDAALVVEEGEEDDPDVTTIQHGFGGSVLVVGNIDGNPTHFKITFEDLETEVCAALADGFVGRTRARTGIVQVDFGGTEVDAPITRANVTTNCEDDVDLGFVFG